MLNCTHPILKLRNLDPFLMLDEFKVSKPAGFPDHPHRGFETVSMFDTTHMNSNVATTIQLNWRNFEFVACSDSIVDFF